MKKIHGLSKLQQATRQVRNWIAPGGLILLYHRIAEMPTDPFNLCVAPHRFAEHLAILKEHYHPMSLQQVVQTIQAGKQPNRAIAVTFDDGYADNLWNAKPLLEDYDVPATVFVATGHLEQKREFWWDELDRLLLQPGRLPSCLNLNINGKPYYWELGEASDYSDDDYQRDRTWNWYVQEQSDPGARQRLYRSLYQRLYPLSLNERQSLLDKLLAWSGAPATGRSTYRSLSPIEVCQLEQGELIEIGAHTINHPFLATLPIEAQQQEIQQSKTELETLLNHPVNSFAYPHGNYTTQTIDLVRKTGFACACSTSEHRIRQPANCFQLPRVVVGNWDGDTFARWLSNWFHS